MLILRGNVSPAGPCGALWHCWWCHSVTVDICAAGGDPYLDAGALADVDPPETVEAVGVGLGVSRGQHGAAALCQVTAAGN